MISLLTAGALSFAITLFLTPYFIRVLRARNIGQFIQEEVEGHLHKRGTPTMGGIVILLAVTAGYVFAHMRFWVLGKGFTFELREISLQGVLVLFAFLGMGLIGFLDDYAKYARKQNLGLSKRWKFLGQLAIAGVFAWGAIAADTSTELAFTRGLGIDLGPIGYAFLVLLMLTGAANAVNLADGLDGLAAGSGALVFGAFMILGFWQFRNISFYEVEGALGLGLVARTGVGVVRVPEADECP